MFVGSGCGFAHLCSGVQRPEKGIKFPGAEVQVVVNHAERVLISAPARAELNVPCFSHAYSCLSVVFNS